MSLSDRDGVIWFDGQMVPWREARVHVLSHTLHYGMGVFEGVRAYDTPEGVRIFRLEDHTDRLLRSAHIIGMSIPFTREQLLEAQRAVIRENSLSCAYLRPMCFYGAEGLGLKARNLATHCIVAAWEPQGGPCAQMRDEGIRVRTSSYTRLAVNAALSKAKCNGHYVNSMLALREALACGYDDAVMLDSEGYVAEGPSTNLFLVTTDGVLCTPGGTSCLEGITRDTIMCLAREQGLDVREKRITRDEVYVACEVFMTGTAAEVVPVREYDGRVIGSGRRGPATALLQSLYFDQVSGRRASWPGWLASAD